jgi:hypothetical protein
MRQTLLAGLLGLALLTTAAPARVRAQAAAGSGSSESFSAYYGAPGNFGMAWGFPSYGVGRGYTEFSSPYGLGYAYGYAPYAYLPGRYGVGLWRPGYSVPGYTYESSAYQFYRTFPYTLRPVAPPPPVGAYAPGYGPPAYYGW